MDRHRRRRRQCQHPTDRSRPASRQLHPYSRRTKHPARQADDTRSAAAYFAAGLYDNMVIFNLLKATDINLKISNTNTSVGDWTCIGNLRLFYYGYNTKLSEVTYVNAIPADTAAPSSVYSVSGVKIGVDPSDSDALRPGMYVIDGRKVVKER